MTSAMNGLVYASGLGFSMTSTMALAAPSTGCAPGSLRLSTMPTPERVEPELRRDDARQDERDVDAGMGRAQLDAERRGQQVHRALDRAVGGPHGSERRARQAARDVDDLAGVPRLEVRQDGLDAVDDALHVVAPHRVEVVVDEVGDRARDAATGVVDPDVDAPEALDRRPGEALDVAPLRHVGDDRERAVADRLGDRVELRLAARREDDLRPRAPSCFASSAPMPALAPVMTTTLSIAASFVVLMALNVGAGVASAQ